jgi:hypothetical protein
MVRYAVLRDLDDPELRPVALVTEHDVAVHVHFAIDCGLRTEYREPYTVAEPDGTFVRYQPGDREYFDSVVTTLSRTFVVDEVEQVEAFDPRTLVDLYVQKIVVPRSVRRTSYAHAVVVHGSSVTAYGEPAREQNGVATAADSMLATAA